MRKFACVLLGLLFPVSAAADLVTITSPLPTPDQLITDGCIHVYALAQSDAGAKIKGWHIYVDKKDTGYRAPNTARVNARVCVPTVSIGTHTVFARAWSSTGSFGDSIPVSVTISGDFSIVAPRDEALSPVAGQSFNNGLIRVSASAYHPYPLTKWIVYVDGQRAFVSYLQAVQVKTDVPVSLGTHRVTVKIWDVNNNVRSYTAKGVVVTQDPMNVTNFVKPPSTAITLSNLDDAGVIKWQAPKTGGAASCRNADLVCNASAPWAVMAPVQFVATPTPLPVASDGMAAVYQTLPGTEPYGNALYGSRIFDIDPTRTHFVVDLWVMPTSTNEQTVELDLWQTINGTTFMFGTQCNFASGHWDFWDDTPTLPPDHPHWRKIFPTPQNNDLVCNLKPNEWTHLRYHMVHDATSYRFISLEVNGVDHSLAELAPSGTTIRSWLDDGTAVQVQLDSNLSATPFGLYVDNYNVTKW